MALFLAVVLVCSERVVGLRAPAPAPPASTSAGDGSGWNLFQPLLLRSPVQDDATIAPVSRMQFNSAGVPKWLLWQQRLVAAGEAGQPGEFPCAFATNAQRIATPSPVSGEWQDAGTPFQPPATGCPSHDASPQCGFLERKAYPNTNAYPPQHCVPPPSAAQQCLVTYNEASPAPAVPNATLLSTCHSNATVGASFSLAATTAGMATAGADAGHDAPVLLVTMAADGILTSEINGSFKGVGTSPCTGACTPYQPWSSGNGQCTNIVPPCFTIKVQHTLSVTVHEVTDSGLVPRGQPDSIATEDEYVPLWATVATPTFPNGTAGPAMQMFTPPIDYAHEKPYPSFDARLGTLPLAANHGPPVAAGPGGDGATWLANAKLSDTGDLVVSLRKWDDSHSKWTGTQEFIIQAECAADGVGSPHLFAAPTAPSIVFSTVASVRELLAPLHCAMGGSRLCERVRCKAGAA